MSSSLSKKNQSVLQNRSTVCQWKEYFERNCQQRYEIPWERGIQLEPLLVQPLIRSFQRFQVGEQGDGAHLRQAARKTHNPDYSEAINLFVAEEQEHSRLLARFIQALSGPLLTSHWTDSCFVLLRRLMGLHTELFILLVAEIIAQVYYRIIRDGTHDIVLQTLCQQILDDEDGHVAFHCDYLHNALQAYPSWVRQCISWMWHCIFAVVCTIVIYDHRGLLNAVAITPPVFWQQCHQAFARAHMRIFEKNIPARE